MEGEEQSAGGGVGDGDGGGGAAWPQKSMLEPEYLTVACWLGSMTRMALSNASEAWHVHALVAKLGVRQPAAPGTLSSSWYHPVYSNSFAAVKARVAGGGAAAAQTTMLEPI